MDFKELQQKMIKNALDYGERHNIKIDAEFALVKLFEEVGEFAQASLIHQKKCRSKKLVTEAESKQELGKELADIIGVAIVNAYLHGIDLEEAIDKKWINKEK